jgi:hypothetical protein
MLKVADCDARGGNYINWLGGAECHENVKSESSYDEDWLVFVGLLANCL